MQADAAGPAVMATTAASQVSKTLIPQPAKLWSAAAIVRKGTNTRSTSSRGRFNKEINLYH